MTILLDAFVVRMTIVPAVLALLGKRAWWLPRWLDRVLPHLDIEGQTLARHLTPCTATPGAPGQSPASGPGQGPPGLARPGRHPGCSAATASYRRSVVNASPGSTVMLIPMAALSACPPVGRRRVGGAGDGLHLLSRRYGRRGWSPACPRRAGLASCSPASPAPRWPGPAPTPRHRCGHHRLCHRPGRAGLHPEPAAARAGDGRAVLHGAGTSPKTAYAYTATAITILVCTAVIASPDREPLAMEIIGTAAWLLLPVPLGITAQAADRLHRGRPRPRRVRGADQRGRGAAPGHGGADADRQGTARRDRPPPRPGQRPGRHRDLPDGHRAR